MVAERQDKRPMTDSQKELVAKNLHTKITAFVRAHIPEPELAIRPDYSLEFVPIVTVQLPTENGSKKITITGRNYPWSNTNSPMNNLYTIEDSLSRQRFSISNTNVTTDIDPEGKDSQENSERVRKLLAEIANPKAEISGKIEIESSRFGCI